MSVNINGTAYRDSRGLAEAAGISLDRLRRVNKPNPDLVLGGANYYRPETVESWVRARGGRK
jgi:hypothetical protein